MIFAMATVFFVCLFAGFRILNIPIPFYDKRITHKDITDKAKILIDDAINKHLPLDSYVNSVVSITKFDEFSITLRIEVDTWEYIMKTSMADVLASAPYIGKWTVGEFMRRKQD